MLVCSPGVLSSVLLPSAALGRLYRGGRDEAERWLLLLTSCASACSRRCLRPGVRQELARWLQRSIVAVAGPAGVPLPPALQQELQEASALPESHPHYWPTLARLVALGWIGEAVELLGLHSAWLRWDGSSADPATSAQVAVLEAATLLLRRFPALQGRPAAPDSGSGSSSGAPPAGREFASPSELLAYQRTWQAQCRALLAGEEGQWRACEEAAPDTAEGLLRVLEVAAGREEALVSACQSWPELLVAQLLHAHPSASPQAELRQLLQRCYAAAAGSATTAFLQTAADVLAACCDADAQTAMQACSSFCSDWFMSHAPELMAAHPAGGGGGGQFAWLIECS